MTIHLASASPATSTAPVFAGDSPSPSAPWPPWSPSERDLRRLKRRSAADAGALPNSSAPAPAPIGPSREYNAASCARLVRCENIPPS
eukprot:3359192-Pyramimonas_sp.AAC.1